MTTPRRLRDRRPTPILLLALALALAACGGGDDEAARLREENEALKRQLADAGQEPPAAGVAEKDDWAWADEPPRPAERPAASRPPEAPVRAPVEPAAPRPRPVTPPPAPPLEPEPAPEPPVQPAATPPPEPATVVRVAATGTAFEAVLGNELSASRSLVGDPVAATLGGDLRDPEGNVVLPAGTQLVGRVTEVKAPGKAKKMAVIAFRIEQATLPDGTAVALSAGRRLEGRGYTKKDGAIIGGSAAGGALLGQVLGKDTEATVGGAILGGAIATGVVLSKRGEDVVIPAGTVIGLELDTPVPVERPQP